MKVALLASAATVTLAGTVAADVLLLLSVTIAPPLGAAPVSVTVPCEALPPATVLGLRVTPLADTAFVTVSTAPGLDPPKLAEIVELVETLTGNVVTVKVALLAPAATVTLAGTVAADVLLLVSDTIAPPLGAGPVSVTVPCEGLPPTTVLGFSATLLADTPPPPPPDPKTWNSAKPMLEPTACVTVNLTELIVLVGTKP